MILISPRFRFLRCFPMLSLVMLVMLTSCIKSPSEPAIQEPASITLSSYSIVLTSIGQRVLINATVLDQDSRVIADATIFFRSSNEKIATVGNSGLVTAVSMGTTQITVTSGYATATATVTVVQEAGSVEVTPSGAILWSVGQSAQFNAVLYDTGGSAIPGAVVVWSSSEPGVATVDANGLVTAVSDGITQITATSSGFMTSRSVHVMIPRLAARIELDVSEATLTSVGQSLQLHAFVFDGEGVPIPGASVFWSSSHPLVATVNDSGLVIAVSNGITGIKASVSGISAYATISVFVEGTVPPSKPPDRDALIAFYNATDGPNWTNNTNWLSDEVIEEWYGVATDNNLYVSGLSLHQNNLTGTIPPEIGQLQELRSLHLPVNRLTGSIPPEIGQLSNLSYLSFFGNELTGEIPPELLQLHSLQNLHLGSNELTGEIPSNIDQLVNLRGLVLFSNQLTGEIPPQIGNLINLQVLWLSSNQFTGEIPPRIGNLHILRNLDLGGNQLTGEIPRQIGDLSNLQDLGLSGNQLSGALPSEIGLLVKLDELYLSYNENLSGPIPVRLTAITNLRILTLEETQLCVPSHAAFQAWLDGIETKWGVKFCEE